MGENIEFMSLLLWLSHNPTMRRASTELLLRTPAADKLEVESFCDQLNVDVKEARDGTTRATTTLETTLKNEINVVSIIDARYPAALRAIPDPPLCLFYCGVSAIECLNHCESLAVVGTRKADPKGFHFTSVLARELAQNQVTIVSGLAQGIDTAAHLGALDSGYAQATVAVLAHGLERVYPAINRSLANRVREAGLLISEYPVGIEPRRHRFLERNRIVSGLSRGCLVVQAAKRSGALATARFALEQGREVLAVPGDISRGLHEGCHHLLREGAALVESSQDVLDQFGWSSLKSSQRAVGLSTEQRALLKQIVSNGVQHIEDLAGFPTLKIQQLLLELEMLGVVALEPGNKIAVRQS